MSYNLGLCWCLPWWDKRSWNTRRNAGSRMAKELGCWSWKSSWLINPRKGVAPSYTTWPLELAVVTRNSSKEDPIMEPHQRARSHKNVLRDPFASPIRNAQGCETNTTIWLLLLIAHFAYLREVYTVEVEGYPLLIWSTPLQKRFLFRIVAGGCFALFVHRLTSIPQFLCRKVESW